MRSYIYIPIASKLSKIKFARHVSRAQIYIDITLILKIYANHIFMATMLDVWYAPSFIYIYICIQLRIFSATHIAGLFNKHCNIFNHNHACRGIRYSKISQYKEQISSPRAYMLNMALLRHGNCICLYFTMLYRYNSIKKKRWLYEPSIQ